MARVIGRGREALTSWVRKCLEAGGIPTFVVEYAGRPLPNNSVLVRCFGAGDKVRGGMISDIPTDLLEKIKSAKKDITTLAEELGVA